MKFPLLLVFLSLLVFFLPQHAFSHSGGLASDGCHFNHKLGTRHCHRGKDGEKTNEVNCRGLHQGRLHSFFTPPATHHIRNGVDVPDDAMGL